MTTTPPATGTDPATPDPDPATPDPSPEPASPDPAATGDDPAAEAAKWKALARKHEERAKANESAAKELEKVKAASMSDQEKAVEAARQEARAATLLEVAGERVADAVRLAAAGTDLDVDALLDGLDRSRFVTDDGQPDADKVKGFVESIAPKAPAAPPDLGQGARGTKTSTTADPLLKTVQQMAGLTS